MPYLVLTRHGRTSWNIEGKWTGWTDIPLGEVGIEEAKKAGESIKDMHFDIAFTSALQRTKESLEALRSALNFKDFPVVSSQALNERKYGEYTARNKWDIKKEYGDEKFKKLHRGWDMRIPGGESLEDVYNRVVPYYKSTILPHILKGENVLICFHGNTMRALIKYLENISNTDIEEVEAPTGGIVIYDMDKEGKVISKQIKANKVNSV